MSIPRILQNQKLRSVKLPDGGPLVTAELVGVQHYLIWSNGTPVTEVRCIPVGSGRWYWRGSRMNWAQTRMQAIVNGRARLMKNCGIDGKPLESWSDKAQAAIAVTEQSIAARRLQIAVN